MSNTSLTTQVERVDCLQQEVGREAGERRAAAPLDCGTDVLT